MNGVILKPGKEKILQQKSHWIFSGAIARYPENFQDGDVASIFSHDGTELGLGYFHSQQSLAGRVLIFETGRNIEDVLEEKVASAVELRRSLFSSETTNAFRLINGEGDGLPGLIVDQYATVLVIQVHTLGIEKLKEKLTKILQAQTGIEAIFEKSDSPSRAQEGLSPQEGWLRGSAPEPIAVRENGLEFFVELTDSQKTGFFLDQRNMRQYLSQHSQGKSVLNCFSYTGGFSAAALAGGATKVDSVDVSKKAIDLAEKNCKVYSGEKNFFCEDVFTFLRESDLNYDIVVLDPPAFAKKRSDIPAAMKGYRNLNKMALEKMPAKSILITSSCSYYIDDTLFQKLVFQAAREANRSVRIVQKHRLAEDHPINIFQPESEYLKSLVLWVE